jgi:hypothetical protein
MVIEKWFVCHWTIVQLVTKAIKIGLIATCLMASKLVSITFGH